MTRHFATLITITTAIVVSTTAPTSLDASETLAADTRSAKMSRDGGKSDDGHRAVFKVINAGGPGCSSPGEEVQRNYDKYGAWHFCFTYQFKAEADFFTDVTNIVYDVMNVVIPLTNFVELYQPTQSSLRFQVGEGKPYRLYKYWTHHIGNVPPLGRYTDHKFVNVQERSIDYWWKLKQRETGKNARISGVAEVVFVPDELFEKAKADGFLQ